MKTRTNQPVTTFDVEDLEVTGELKAFENIVDKDGNPRFVEGIIPVKTITGWTFTYHKWSLSGSHLMLVVAGTVASGTTYSASLITDNFKLPKYITDKIVNTKGVYVDYKGITFSTSGYASSYTKFSNLQKRENDEIAIEFFGTSETFSADVVFRIEYDLIIDNE